VAVLPHSSVAVTFTLNAVPAVCSIGVGTLKLLALAALTVIEALPFTAPLL